MNVPAAPLPAAHPPPPTPADPEPLQEREPNDPEKGRVPAPDPGKSDHPAG